MSRNPFFLSLALASWLCLMGASILFPALWPPLPALFCSAVMCLALLWRMRGRALPWPVRCILPAATLLPALFFLLARAFMGQITSTMIFGLGCVLVALPLDAAFTSCPGKQNNGAAKP